MNFILLSTLLISALKILDNFIGTSKSILVHKNKAFAASMLIIVSQFLFYFVISKIISENNMIVVFAVSIASGLGSFIAFKINDRFSKEKVYLNIITSKHKNDMTELCEFLREHDIKNIVTDSYKKDWTKSYAVQVFTINKVESMLVDKFIAGESNKYFREILY